jgi:hypothetical protein
MYALPLFPVDEGENGSFLGFDTLGKGVTAIALRVWAKTAASDLGIYPSSAIPIARHRPLPTETVERKRMAEPHHCGRRGTAGPVSTK